MYCTVCWIGPPSGRDRSLRCIPLQASEGSLALFAAIFPRLTHLFIVAQIIIECSRAHFKHGGRFVLDALDLCKRLYCFERCIIIL
jgi:hypothetical protein